MISTTKPEPAPTKPVVYGWMPLAVDADTSPACYKLETFLKMCKVDFDTTYFVDHKMSETSTTIDKQFKNDSPELGVMYQH